MMGIEEVVVVVVVEVGVDEELLLGEEDEDVELDGGVATLVAMVPSKAVAWTIQFSSLLSVVSMSDEPPSVLYCVSTACVLACAQDVHHAPCPGRSLLSPR
jgi:hypothetical protein